MKIKAALLKVSFLTGYFTSSHSQVVLQPVVSDDKSPQTLKQEDIDALKTPAEGFWVFNTTTGCINYYLNGCWHELCGTCLPRPGHVEDVSITKKGNDYFLRPRISGSCEKLIWQHGSETHELSFRTGDSLRLPTSYPVPQDSFEVWLIPVTKCGKGTSFRLVLKNHFPLRLSPVRIDSLSGIRYRSTGALSWMADDFQPHGTFRRPLPERPDIILLKPSEEPCPPGWRLPTPQEWEDLLSPFGENLQPLLEPPKDDNFGLGLSLANMYASEEKKIIGEGLAGLYYTSKRNGKTTYFASPRRTGFLIVPEQSGKAGAGVRCVR